MTAPPPASPPADPRRHLSGWWFFALILGLCVLFALVGATAKELGGENGEVVGSVAVLAVTCVVGLILPRLFANPFIPILSAMFVGMAAGGVAEAAGLRGDAWRSALRWVIFGSVYLLWAAVATRLARPAGHARIPTR